ncbi:MAG TPA: ArsA-related P-loop ATPase [Vulgatibacter sp.]
MSGALREALRERRVIVCVGAGGVGKTTVAATLALRAAVEGRRTMVLTIDPARRLANALGLKELGNVETRVDPARLREAGLEPKGELFAMMLDLQRSWDDLISRYVPPKQREALLRNRFYQTLSSALAGSQEYIATEKLYELHARGDYDLLVLDTPPTSHALDFLDAPKRILDFLDQRPLRAVAGPALAAGRIGFKLMTLGGSVAGKALSRLTGTETLEELTAFMLEIQGTYGVFKERAAQVKELFTSSESAFVLVTSPHGANIDEAVYFHERLAEEGIPVAGVVANRVHPDFLGEAPLPAATELAACLSGSGLPDTGDPPLSERLLRTLEEARATASLDRRHLLRLADATRPSPLLRVPRFDSDLYDLPGLWAMGLHLFAEE